jgi:tryptophanyl-tRNA synthetase
MTTPVTASAPSDAILEVAGRRKRMLTGDRPTGKLHLGHFVGSVENRIRLQHEYEAFFIIADLHMLTTSNTRADIDRVSTNARDMVLDQLSAGIDPEKATFYLQSAIPEVSELNTLFQNLVTVPRLERVPSLKDMARAAGKDEMPYGLLGYPVLQAADILCVKGDVVPVGKDNHAHVEVTREIARRFNNLYGEVFPVPELVVSEITTLVGTDGQAKMSKSIGNTILLSDDAETVRRKVRGMYTDPNRIRADIPGTVEGNPVFLYHDAFNQDDAEVADLKDRYRSGSVGDVEVKEKLAVALNAFLEPMRERRAQYESRPGYVDEIIVDGTERTRSEVKAVVAEVKKAMGITGTYNQLRRKAEQARRRRGE